MAKLLGEPDISVVVLAARWDARDIVPGHANESELFTRNLENTIIALERTGKKVIVLGQVPPFARSLKSCLTKQVRFGVKIPDCDGIASSVVGGYETEISRSMQSLSQEHSKAVFFAPRSYLCQGATCSAIDKHGHPLYMDDDHLNARGAYFLEPYIDEAIAQLLPGSRPKIVETKLP